MCNEFSRCYNDVNICLWTEGTEVVRSDAQSKCTQPKSFIPRITNSDIQNKLAEFRSDDNSQDSPLLDNSGFWIDVNATATNDFHWINGSSLTGHSFYLEICWYRSITISTI